MKPNISCTVLPRIARVIINIITRIAHIQSVIILLSPFLLHLYYNWWRGTCQTSFRT